MTLPRPLPNDIHSIAASPGGVEIFFELAANSDASDGFLRALDSTKVWQDQESVAEQEHATEGEEEHEEGVQMPKELPNLYTWIEALRPKGDAEEAHGEDEAHGFFFANPIWFVNPLFSLFYAVVLVLVITKILKKKSVRTPSKAQVGLELLFGGLFNFFGEVLGKQNARKYVPYVGTLWLFILTNNLAGLIPLLKSPTAHFETTIALGLCTFLYVNFQGLKAGGIKHYLWHLCGSPTDVVGWFLVIMMLPLEIVGALIKPVSLALRLFGNVFGEDTLLAAFLGLGLMLVGAIFHWATPLFGIPLHTPFLFLAVLTSTIQATVFALLSAIYIALLLPHDHDNGDHEHAEAGAH